MGLEPKTVGEVGDDSHRDRMLAACQGRATWTGVGTGAVSVGQWVALLRCEHPHGPGLDARDRLVLVGCDRNTTLNKHPHMPWDGSDQITSMEEI
jgi:ribosomal protein L2